MKKEIKTLNLIVPVLSVVVVIALWSVAAVAVNSEYVLPNVFQTLRQFIKLFADGGFYLSLLLTVARSLISFILSFALALTFGLLAKKHPIFKKFMSPIIAIMRALPTVAVVLLLLVWTNSFIAPIIVTSLVVLPTVYTDVLNDLCMLDEKQIEMCKVFKVSTKDILFKVQLPQIMPALFNTIGSALSLNLKLMVAAEVLSSTGNSLGNLLNVSNVNLETATMLALVLAVVILGIIIEGVFGLLSKRAGEYL